MGLSNPLYDENYHLRTDFFLNPILWKNQNQRQAIVTEAISSKHLKSVIGMSITTFLLPIINIKHKNKNEQEAVQNGAGILSIINTFLRIIRR